MDNPIGKGDLDDLLEAARADWQLKEDRLVFPVEKSEKSSSLQIED